jgi:hypothetical protein
LIRQEERLADIDKSLLEDLNLEEREKVHEYIQALESTIDSSVGDLSKLLEVILSLSNDEAGVKLE